MQAFLIKLIINIALMIILAPKPQNQKSNAGTLEDFTFPTADETRPIQLVYGTVKSEGPNVLYYGDFSAEDITRKVKKIIGSSTVNTGYSRYYLGLQFGLGWGEMDLLQVYTDEKLIWEQDGTTTGSFTGTIDLPEVYNTGEIKEGIVGDFDFIAGESDAVRNQYLFDIITSETILEDIPNWKNVCQFVWKGGYLGNQKSLRPFKFVLRRTFTPPDLDTGSALKDYSYIEDKVDPRFYSMNPIYIIYDLMTNPFYGVKYSINDIDIDSFKAAAKQCWEEGYGLSILKDTQTTARELLDEIQKYPGIQMRLNRTNNKYEIKFIRDDYNVEDLQVFDTSNIVKVITYSAGSVDKKMNEVKIKYTVPSENFIERIASFTNEGARFEKFSIDYTIRDYLFLNDADMAAFIAQRDCIPLTTDLSSLEIDVSYNDSFDLLPGDAFVFSFEPYGIEKIFRVQEVKLSEDSQKSAKISAIQDSFGVKYTTFPAPPSSTWNPINLTPQPANLNLFNAPLFFGQNKVVAYAEKPSGATINYELFVNGSYDSLATGFTKKAIVQNDYSASESSSIEVLGLLSTIQDNGAEYIQGGNNLCLIVNPDNSVEFISFETITYSSITQSYSLKKLWRGVLDTRQKDIQTGAEIYFISYGFAINEYSLSTGSNDFEAYTYTDKEKIITPPTVSFDVSNRYLLPICPAGLEVNGVLMGDTIPSLTDLTLSWNIRNRENQDLIVKSTTQQTTTIENGTTYELIISDENDVVLKTESLTTNTYTFSDETTIGGGSYYNTLKIELYALNGTDESFDKYNLTLTRA